MRFKQLHRNVQFGVLVLLELLIVGMLGFIKPLEQNSQRSQPDDYDLKRTVHNAAAHYLDAVDQLKDPYDKEFTEGLRAVIENGWDPHDDLYAQYLNDNKPCLDMIYQAMDLICCDFESSVQYKLLYFKEDVPFVELLELGRLLLLNARYHEYHKNTAMRLEAYLHALTYAYHLSQDRSTIGLVVSSTIERETYPLIGYFVESEASRADISRLNEYLSQHQERHLPVQAFIYYERDFFISTMQTITDSILADSSQKEIDTENNDAFVREFNRQAQRFAARWYGCFVSFRQGCMT